MPLDHAAFRALFEAEHLRVHRFLWRLTRNAADADDLVQETFLAAWSRRGTFDGRGPAGGWLMAIAHRTWLDMARKRGRRRALAERRPPAPLAASVDDPGRAEWNGHVAASLRAAVDELPDGPREAFTLFHLGGLSTRDVGEVLGLEPQVVNARVRRALELLGRRLGWLPGRLAIG
jgi:RNA polymerase sigma factor (sigma-70 family)